MKIGISMYSYNRSVNKGAITLSEAIKDAKAAGYEQVEFVDLTAPEGVSLQDYAGQLRRMCGSEGLKISGYMVSADFINNRGGDAAKEAGRLKGCLDIAAIMGAKVLRHDVTWDYHGKRGDYKEAAETVAPYIRTVAEYGASLGVKTMTENHGYFFQDSYRMEYLVDKVNHPNYGLLIDMGNFLCADEDPISAVARLAPYAFHLHAKDFLYKNGAAPSPDETWFPTRGGNLLRGTVIGHGVVPVRQCVAIMKNAKYAGDIAVEFEGLEDPKDAARLGYAYLRNIL